MSINVHVTGNPISIKRGKMVTSDLDYNKTEFDKRRLMRLEQVRQQSKDIAEDVRNKVRKEKKKQMREIEKEGKDKLKNWQNRKLLELQTQYENALRDIGSGHRQADAFQDESDYMAAQHEINKQISNQRGKEATTKLHLEKNEKVAMKNVSSERKKLTREIENTRSAIVAKFPKSKLRNGEPHIKKKKRTPSAGINITISDSESDPSQSTSPNEVDDTEESEDGESQDICDSTNESNSTAKSPIREEEKNLAPERHQKDTKNWQIPPLRLSTLHENDSMDSDRKFISEETNLQSVPSFPPQMQSKSPEPPRDTRISDRIRRRGIMASQPDYCSNVAETHPIPFIESNTKIREAIDSRIFGRPCPNTTDKISDKVCFCSRPFSNGLEIDQRLNVSPDPGCICAMNQKTCHPMCGKMLPENENETAGDLRSSVAKDQQKFTNVPSKRKSSAGHKQLSQINDNSSKPSFNHSENQTQYQEISSKPLVKPKPLAGHIPHPTQFSEYSSKPSVAQSDNQIQLQDIPSKPSVKLKSSTSHSDSLTQISKSTDTNKVQFYDHPNRFTHTKKMPSYVEKIPTESLEVIPDVTSETEWLEKIKQRDKEAQVRGKKALNKEKVRKDYEEMMKKLPLLQKKERISEIYNDKPEYHMSEDRLKERERIKQNNLENAFNKMFPDLKPAIVTLPRKTLSKDNIEIPEEEAVRSLNVGKWDVDFEEPKMFTAQEVQEIVRAFTGHETQDRRAKLKDLLRSLKLQKEQLLKEIGSLPRDESINELINDLKSFSDSDDIVGTKSRKKERSKSGKKRSRDRKEKDTSADSSQEHSEKDQDRRYRQPEQDANKSPRKKAKMRSRRKVLVLQNISTQTTPKVKKDPEGSDTKLPAEICAKLHTPCDCNKENEKQPPEELCQILIRLNDDENPDIVVKSKEAQLKKVESKSVGIGTEESPKISKKPLPTVAERDKSVPQPKASGKTKSTWRDQLSKNSISTTSTSYMSPPDLQKTRDSQKSSLYNLRRKPQQKELSSAFSNYQPQDSLLNGSVDPKFVDQIQKLLRMARGSVENLNVSTSSVPTPTQSIIEMESNNPKADIFDMLKAFHLKIGNIAEGLSYSPDISPVPYNTSVSTTESDILPKQDSSSRTASRLVIPERDSSTSNKSKESVLAQYADITDSCSKRIQTLADMIQKLREEKIQLLQVPPETSRSKSDSPILSDKDFSTAYMDLPDSKESSKNSANSLDEEEIYKKLMEIDISLANKLRQFTIGEKSATQLGGGSNETEASASKEHTPSLSSTNQEIITRLKQLQQQEVAKPQHEVPKPQHEVPTTSKLTEVNDQPFVSFLSDIPKLPKFEAQPSTLQTNHKRPPPSKGLTVVRKFNGNISLTPHELSTIVEADSQLSTKMGSNVPSPNASKISMGMSSLKDIELIMIPERKEVPESRSDSTEPEKTPQIAVTAQRKSHNQTSPKKPQQSPNDSKKSSSTQKDEKSTSSEKEYNDISKISSNTTASRSNNYCDDSSCGRKSLLKTTSSSSDDMEKIEAMLKSIGMEWAIPTLHKTQEALALTSSSSSLDLTSKKKNESSGSEISLKEFLRRQMLSRVSSSTMKTDASPGSLLGDFSDLSAIQAANSSVEKEKQRTSTPMTSSKSTSKSRAIFSADSDISSVRNDTLNRSKRK